MITEIDEPISPPGSHALRGNPAGCPPGLLGRWAHYKANACDNSQAQLDNEDRHIPTQSVGTRYLDSIGVNPNIEYRNKFECRMTEILNRVLVI